MSAALALALLITAAEPTPRLASLEGLNPKALRPWLEANLASLARCPKALAGKGDEVKVNARFTEAGEPKRWRVEVLRVEGPLREPRCVRDVIESWKNDGHQPSAGPFSFVYRY